jgi:hypothetical protein
VAKLRTKKYSPHILPVRSSAPNLKVPVSTIYTYRNFRPPKTKNEQYDLLNEFIEWSFVTTATNPIDFPLEKRINPHHFFNLGKEDPLFADMIELVKYKFASRLEHNPVVSPNYTASRMRYYDKEYGDWSRAEVAKIIDERMKINVIMQEIPKSDKVPERKLDD